MAFFALGLEKVSLYSNREWFNPAEVRFHSFVIDQQLSLPEAQDLIEAGEVERRDLFRSTLAPKVLGLWETINVANIPDRHTFLFGDTGRILYRSSEIPESLDWFMLVIEDDSDIRQLGQKLKTFLTDERVDKLSKSIVSLSGVGTSPAVAAGVVIAKELVGAISLLLKGNRDDQLGVVEQSFIRGLHYPFGTRQGVGVQDLSGNMWYDYFIYGSNNV